MNNLEAKDLFYETRFPTQISKIIYLIAYTPIGIVLIILRLSLGFLALIFASTLSDTSTLRNIISRLLCISLGIVIETEDYDKKDENAKLIVSNHVSDLDHIALHAATSSVMPTNYKMQSVLENALGLISINTLITEDVLETLNKPIAVLPEDTVTNGKAILKFKSHVFNLNTKIQPVGLKIWRPPVAELAVKTLGSEWWLDILTFLFVPCTFYRVKFLPVIEKGELNEHDFAELIRESISKCLHVPMVPMTSRDMMEYEKRYSLEQRRSRIPRPSVNVTSRNSTVLPELSNNTVILRMAQQVKEVLPRVPLNVILQDLAKTHSIDYTISNILEGHIRYVPETNDETSASSSTNSQSSPSADSGTMPSSSAPLSTAASTFAKSANERMQSQKTPYTVKKYRTTMRDVELGSIVLTCHSARRFRSARERWWFIAVSNCYNNKGINIKYQFRLTNGLIGDYWHEHFSADEFYVLPILMFYMVIYSFMFMLIILCSIQLKSRQLLHSTYKLFMFSVQLQYVGIVVQTMAMLKYATNGMGYPKLKTFGTVMTAASEVCFLLLLLLLAKGFTITRGRLPISESINLTMFMCFYTIIYSALFIYEEKVFDPGEVLYLYESPAGYGLMVLRIVAWCIFIYSTICTLQHYSEKSNFYYPFNVCGTLWFISGPAFILTANAYIDKWVRESIVCAVLLFIAFGGHFMFMLLTLPSYANKNFPYHVRTTQIGIMEVATISGNSTIDHFGHSVYGPARDDELEQSIIIPLTQRTEELAEMHNNQSSAYDVFTVSQTGVTPSAPNLFTERKSKRNKLFTIENNLDEVRINNTINRFTVTTSMSNLRSETKDT